MADEQGAPQDAAEPQFSDVLIIGAGISGINAAYRIQQRNPGSSYTILERRQRIGGTWDLFRYPGIRSDSDIFTLSYPYEPWTRREHVADGADIREYLTTALLPCLFNSGCGIGRHGVTGIEIVHGRIALVYWVDRGRTDKYFDAEGYGPQRLGDSDYYRVVLKEEDLDYIFTRINLLG